MIEFYSIYDGFGEISAGNSVLGSGDIGVMAGTMNPICDENDFEAPEEYDFADLLAFSRTAATRKVFTVKTRIHRTR